MNTYYLLAYITGGIMVAYSVTLYIFPSRRLNLFLKAGVNALNVINLVFVYLATNDNLVIAGMVVTGICCAREILFSFRNDTKVLDNILWPIGISILLLSSLIFTYKSPLSLLPAIGSVVSTMGFYANNQKIFKFGALISCALFVTYYAILIPSSNVLTIFSLACAAAGLLSAIIGLIVLLIREKKRKDQKNN